MKHNILQKESVMVIATLFTSFLWGSAYPSIKIIYSEIGVLGEFEKLILAGFRFAIAGLVVLVFSKVKLKAKLKPERNELLLTGVLGLLTFATFTLFFIGLGYTSSTKGPIVSSVGIFFVAIFSHFMSRSNRMNVKKTIGLICGFTGVVLANITFITQAAFSFTLNGEGFLIFHAVLSAITTVLIKKHAYSMDVVRVNGWQLLLGGVLLLFVGFAGHPAMPLFNVLSAGLLVYIGVVSAVSYTLCFLLLRYHKATEVEQYKFAIPLFGSLLSVIFIPGEHMGIEMLGAAVLVATGIFIVNRQNGTTKKVERVEQIHVIITKGRNENGKF